MENCSTSLPFEFLLFTQTQEKANTPAAVACLNEMVTDALKHVPHCLAYMERVRDWQIFRFCAIPQVRPENT